MRRMTKRSGVDVENERAEWMWRISEEDSYLHLAKNKLLTSLYMVARVFSLQKKRYIILKSNSTDYYRRSSEVGV